MRKIALALFLATGCDFKHPHGPATAREEETKARVTAWGNRFEIFLEHKPIVANVPTTFVTHLTDLKTSLPRREGKVAFILAPVTGPEIVHVEDAPQKVGIYEPALTFPEAGEWTVTLRLAVDGSEVVEVLPHFHVYAKPEDAGKGHGHEHDEAEGIPFSKERQWKLLTKTEPATRRRMVERVRLPGVVSAKPGSRAAVVPPLSGRLLPPAGAPLPSLGHRVEAGQTLALLQPPVSDLVTKVVEADAQVARMKLALSQAELAHGRIQKLAAGEAKTARELEESEFALRGAKSAYEAALALRRAYEKTGIALKEEYGAVPVVDLKAPIGGTVIQVGAAVGEQVQADRAVFTILSTESVYIEAKIPEADLPRVARSRGAVYETSDAKGRFLPISEETGGQPVFLGPEVDAATRTVPLVYEVRNPDGALRVGMALSVYVETERAEEALAIPGSALVDEEGRWVAFVQVSGETFQKRDLTLGIRDSGFAQVISGIEPDERVVTKGAYAVRLASLSTSLPAHGHAH